MPEDTSSLLSRHVLESPWPAVLILAVAAAVVGWIALQRDDRRWLVGAAVGLALSIAVAVIGTITTTDREAAVAATRAFVQDAVEGRVDDLVARLHPDATLHVGVIEAPGFPREDLERALDQLDGAHRIKDNMITRLDAADDGFGMIWVELACLTSTASSYGTVPSRWIFEWIPPEPGRPWEVRSITAVSVAGRAPSGRDVLR